MTDNLPATTAPLQLPATVADMATHLTAIREVTRASMVKGKHYGVIQGTKEPTLYKAGAEMLLTLFQISVEPEFENLSTADERRYICRCKGIHWPTSTVIGIGVGCAGTGEERYKWRAAGNKEWDHTPENRRRIKYGWRWGQARGERVDTETKQVRTEPADQENTVIKMAKKRAEVDLCLTALACSDAFGDLEGGGTSGNGSRTPSGSSSARRAPASSSASPPGVMPDKATENQLALIRSKIDGAPFTETDLVAAMGLTQLEQLPFDQVNKALEWISSYGADQ